MYFSFGVVSIIAGYHGGSRELVLLWGGQWATHYGHAMHCRRWLIAPSHILAMLERLFDGLGDAVTAKSQLRATHKPHRLTNQ